MKKWVNGFILTGVFLYLMVFVLEGIFWFTHNQIFSDISVVCMFAGGALMIAAIRAIPSEE